MTKVNEKFLAAGVHAILVEGSADKEDDPGSQELFVHFGHTY